jgi:formylglycine-generating enzyme required for sulfatase activity
MVPELLRGVVMGMCTSAVQGWTLGVALAAVVGGAAALAQPLSLPPAPAGVQVTTEYGMQFSTIVAGPQEWASPQFDIFQGRFPRWGAVQNSYRISRTEVTLADYVGFFNVLSTNPSFLPDSPALRSELAFGEAIGFRRDVDYTGPGTRWLLQSELSGRRAVDWSSWYFAAMFCNYLHNDRSTNPNAVLSGVYDLRNWNQNAPQQRERSPNARFWLPSAHEWYRAVYFRPDTQTWLTYPTADDQAVIYGAPGIGLAMIDIGFSIPVAQYAVQSPWGLFDAAGNAREWTEFSWPIGLPDEPVSGRMAMGSYVGSSLESAAFYDQIGAYYFLDPEVARGGFRIAAAIPAPTSCTIVFLVCVFGLRRNSRRSI